MLSVGGQPYLTSSWSVMPYLDEVLGFDEQDRLEPLHPLYTIPIGCVADIKRYFDAKPGFWNPSPAASQGRRTPLVCPCLAAPTGDLRIHDILVQGESEDPSGACPRSHNSTATFAHSTACRSRYHVARVNDDIEPQWK